MTLLFLDGFDAQDYTSKWPDNTFAGATAFGVGRYGTGKTLSPTSTTGKLRLAIPPTDQVIMGAAVKITAFPTSPATFVVFSVISTTYDKQSGLLAIDSSGYLRAQNASTVLSTSSVQLQLNRWYWLELRTNIRTSSGICQIRVDGQQVVNASGNTGFTPAVDTISAIEVMGSSSTYPQMAIDDFYLCDALGTINNTFLGEISIDTLLPNGSGSETDGAPTGSSNNWQNVNEIPPSDAEYNTLHTVGSRDLYSFSDVTDTTVSIPGIQVVPRIRKSAVGAGKASAVIRSGGENYTLDTVLPGTSASIYPSIRELNPNGDISWTGTAVNALEAGMEAV